jgi:ABC-2 type transport system permease protein
MKQFFILLKASLTEGMDIFRIKKKKDGKSSGAGVTFALMAMMFFIMWVYSNSWFDNLSQVGRESLLLPFVIVLTTILTIIEGIYKSSSLMYNTRDDDLLLTLPISRGKIVTLKLVKFYLFELVFNSMFLLPAMIVYFMRGTISISFVPISILVLLLMPMIPIVLSCFIGAVISAFSAKFKKQTAAQIIFTFIALIVIMIASFYISLSANGADDAGASMAEIGETMANVYYPAGLYEKMAVDFKAMDLGIFVLIHLVAAGVGIAILAKTFFAINTRAKMANYGVTKKVDLEKLEIREQKPIWALVKKELSRFFGTPVFITNAGFGIILFAIGAGVLCWKFDDILVGLEQVEDFPLSAETVRGLLPVALFALMAFSTLLTFITSSMISLEGKSINILKSLPVPVTTILRAKIVMAMMVILPLVILGDIVVAVWFGFGIIETLLLLLGSIVLPASMQLFGILVNLKYPTMDAENDMEIVKQSRSTTICTFVGMGAMTVTIGLLAGSALSGLRTIGAMGITTGVYVIICLILEHRLKKVGTKRFDEITA